VVSEVIRKIFVVHRRMQFSGGRIGRYRGVEGPQSGVRRTAAAENDSVIELNADCVRCERGGTAVVTKLANGNEGSIRETGKDMGGTSCRRKRGNVEFGDMTRSDCATIREDHIDAGDRRLAMYVSNVGAQKMSGTASVCNGVGREKWRGGS
jgi:hypothetical protein